MNTKLCDRCQSSKKYLRKIKIYNDTCVIFGLPAREYDLCDECSKDFYKFLSNKYDKE